MHPVVWNTPVLITLAVWGAVDARANDEPTQRPNIVFVLVDDLRWDEVGCMGHPFVKTPHIDRIAREGVLFRNAFATTPLCSPHRACILTGLYAHGHGITDNTDRSAQSHRLVTFPRLLHDQGYATAYVGKWHMGVDDSPRPGFDRWVSVQGQGRYHDTRLNIDGTVVQSKGYVTDVFNDHAVEFIERRHDKPFLLYLAHKAVHPDLEQRPDGSISDPSAGKFEPAERHRNMYANEPVPRRPNVRDNLAGKPALQRKIGNLPPLGPATGTDDETVRNRLRMLMSVEDGVGRILAALEAKGELDNTLVVFTSDHGYFYGEHGLSVERRLAYEEAIRVPLLVRYPKLIKAGSMREQFVLGIDLCPTFLELGDAAELAGLHGRSLVPMLKGDPAELRDSFLIEYYSDRVFPRVLTMGYQAVRTKRHKLIRYRELEGMDEFYDLEADPYEMRNLIGDAVHRGTLAEVQAELGRLLHESGAAAGK
jgi:N-acetylglucosamine-6-sulfatase